MRVRAACGQAAMVFEAIVLWRDIAGKNGIGRAVGAIIPGGSCFLAAFYRAPPFRSFTD